MKRIALPLGLALILAVACTDRTPTAPDNSSLAPAATAEASHKKPKLAGGPYEVGFTTFTISDPSRDDRPIPVYVWYPADPAEIDGASPEAMYPLDPFHPGEFPDAPSSAFEAYGLDRAYQEPTPAAGPFPLVMFTPGWGGTAYTDGHYVGTALAREGFVVAAVSNWGDQATFHPEEPYDHLALAIYNRPRDVSFALDALLDRNSDQEALLFGSMNPAMIAASGWSIGGYTAMVLAGGDDEVCDLADLFPGWPVPPETCVPSYPDPRISMIIPLDGSNQLLHFQELARVDVPAMGIGEEWAAVGDWQARQHAAFTGHPNYRVDVFNTNHFSFSNICIGWDVMVDYGVLPPDVADIWKSWYCTPGPLDGAEVRRIVTKYMLAFLQDYQPVLTPGHALTREPNVEFFVTEKRSPNSIDEDWPDLFTYFMHQPGREHANATPEATALGVKDPLGARPMEFAFRYLPRGNH